jgi:Flp pilus assembly protein TadB
LHHGHRGHRGARTREHGKKRVALGSDLEPAMTGQSFTNDLVMTRKGKQSPLGGLAQGMQTLPAMMAVIVTLVGGLLGALIAALFSASTVIAVVVAAVVFLLMNLLIGFLSQRAFFKFVRTLPARFPSAGRGV